MNVNDYFKSYGSNLPPQSSPSQAAATITGSVLGRDGEDVIVAIDTGVVAINHGNVKDIVAIEETGGKFADITVKDKTQLRYLRRVNPIELAETSTVTSAAALSNTDSYTNGYVNTYTITGGSYDATDDGRTVTRRDDIEA